MQIERSCKRSPLSPEGGGEGTHGTIVGMTMKFCLESVTGDNLMRAQGHAHLVGSVPLMTQSDVFAAVAGKLGSVIHRIPDGETGERTNWIRWQVHAFNGCPQLELETSDSARQGYQDKLARPLFKLRDGADPAKVELPALGFEREAIKSYGVFAQMQAAGRVPPGVKFQVSIPTAVPLAGSFIVPESRAAVEPAIERALAREVAGIAAAIPHDKLSIQWDVCIEIVGADGGFALYYDRPVDGGIDRVCRHLGFIPADVEAGIHLCYGDPGHKHLIEPKDLATCVTFTKRCLAQSSRPVSYVHMPVSRGALADEFYSPLRNLAVPAETEIYLGLVHFTDGLPGTLARMAIAKRHLDAFGVATECGLGRRDPALTRRCGAGQRRAPASTARHWRGRPRPAPAGCRDRRGRS